MGIVIPSHERQMFFTDLLPLLMIATPHLFLFFLIFSPLAQGKEGDGAKNPLVSVSALHLSELEAASLASFYFGFPV